MHLPPYATFVENLAGKTGRHSEDPMFVSEDLPGGCREEPILEEKNRFLGGRLTLIDESSSKVVLFEFRGNGFTDSDWKDLSETNLELGYKALRGGLEARGRQVVDVRPSKSVLVELHCYTKESFVSLMDDFESGNVKQRLEEEFEKVGYKGELEVAIVNKSDVYSALEQIR